MKWFLDLKLGTKLISSFSLIALIAAYIGYEGYVAATEIRENQDELYLGRLIPIRDLGYANASLLIARGDVRNFLAAVTPEDQQKYLTVVNNESKKVDEYIEKYSKGNLMPEEKEQLSLFHTNWKEYTSIRDEALQMVLAGKKQEAVKMIDGNARASMTAARKTLRALIDFNAVESDKLDVATDAQAERSVTSIFVLLGVGVVLSLSMGFFIAKVIADPVKELVDNIKNADLNSRFNSERKDEIGGLQTAFDGFVEQIKQTLVQVSESSAAVASASTQISSSTEQLAAGAQEQSSQSAEVAGAVEEMTKTIIENSRNASDTAETAKKAKTTAQKGGDVVRQTVVGMKDIAVVVNKSAQTVRALGKSSDQIGEIISVIDDIADQTNLLALNAAIEAARAGEQGRGFAVVADEVRKLAERTTKATKEIASMIKQIQVDTKDAVFSMDEGTKKVNDGIRLADEAGESLKEIIEISQVVTDKISQIAAASEQQSSASEQISKNVEAISTVTQESASGTQQIARTAEDLNRLTENLQTLLNKFNLEGTKQTEHHDAYKRPKYTAQRSRKAVTEHGQLVEH
ncbi:MAG: methyl-accepting chemotaxis protein [Bacteroidota bacterium]